MKSVDISINPKLSKIFIGTLCILGIIHEAVLAISRFLMMPEILFIIGNNYSNNIFADVIAVILRAGIFFAIIFVLYNKKSIRTLTKSLLYMKFLRIIVLFLGVAVWIYIVNNNPVDELDKFRGSMQIIEITIYYLVIAAIVILSIILIAKTKEKVRTIFILTLIASMMDVFVFQIGNFMFMFTPLAMDEFIYLTVGVLYIISFVKAMSLLKSGDKNESME